MPVVCLHERSRRGGAQQSLRGGGGDEIEPLRRARLVHAGGLEFAAQFLQALPVLPRAVIGDGLQQSACDLELDVELLSGCLLRSCLCQPSRDRVAPRYDGVIIDAALLEPDLTLPAVVAERTHGRLAPFVGVRLAIAQSDSRLLVPVGQHIALDGEHLAEHGLGRILAAVDFRGDVADDDARADVRQGDDNLFGCQLLERFGHQDICVHVAWFWARPGPNQSRSGPQEPNTWGGT